MKYKRNSVRKIALFCVVCHMAFSVSTVRAAEKETLRVGFYVEEGYHTVDQTKQHVGYDYAYLMEIAEHTGWQYEFVEGTWEECTQMLERGEIDLLGGLRQREERQDTMCFAERPSEYVINCLVVAPETKDYAYEDFEAFDGIRIGALTGSILDEFLKAYSEENHFTYMMHWYDTEEELQRALEQKEIDSIYLTDNRDLSSYQMIARLGFSELYYGLSKERADLKEELDEAIREIHTQNPYYEHMLYETYFKAPQKIAFTKEEKEYIQQKGKIRVALPDRVPLICEYNPSKKKYEGMIIDILDELSKETGLKFVYEKLPEDVAVGDYIQQNPNMLTAPFYENNMLTYTGRLEILDPIVQSRMIAVSREGSALNLEEEFILTLPDEMYATADKLQAIFPNVQMIPCNSHKMGIDMVKNGQADMTLINDITGSYLLQSPYYRKLVTSNMENMTEDITLAVSANTDPLLISVLNKGIASFQERDIREIVLNNTVTRTYKKTLWEWMYENGFVFFLCTVSVALLLFNLLMNRRKEIEYKQKIEMETERRRADEKYQKKMFHQANFDALTGLYNKAYFIRKSTELLIENPDIEYTFFRINVEQFKMINEIYGLKAGDIILQQIADKLRKMAGKKGIYGRDYSDHFLLCYPIDPEKRDNLTDVAVSHFTCMGQQIRVQFNIGVYVNTSKSTDVNRFMDYAQIALQEKDKTDTDSHVYYYKDSYMENMLRNQKITNEMEHALEDGQFHIFLQPQYDDTTNALVGAEALIRWFHPKEGIIPPGEFIPVFEGNHFIYRLDEYVYEEVCRLLADWKKRGKLIPISVNVSRANIQNPNFLPILVSAIRKYDVPMEYLHLEITESAYVEDRSSLLELIHKMKELGFTVEMDDFGSGYSSFNTLKDLPVDMIKLDMKFFSGETHMDKGGKIIEAIVRMAHSMGMLVIAEGVETEREAHFLASIGCRIIQGYFYGKPIPIPEFEALLADSTIGKKEIKDSEIDRKKNHYWSVEKYHVLLRSSRAILFDYDPLCDAAVFTYMGKGTGVREKTVEQYSQYISNEPRIHQDYRERIRKIIWNEEEAEEMDFLADYYETGEFAWFHATVYTYHRDKKFSRLIALIEQK